MINPYKRQDIFRCHHDSHNGFGDVVSVYHVMKNKRCFPNGCVYFRWRCSLLDKGNPCIRGYNYVGKNCPGCRYYSEDKEMNRPEVEVNPGVYEDFEAELRAFEDWVRDHTGKRVTFYGRIHSVKPRFRGVSDGKAQRLSFHGFLLVFQEGYIGKDHFEDFCYATVSRGLQGRWQLRRGDVVEFEGDFGLDRGRLVLSKLNRIEVVERGDGEVWTESRAHVARATGTVFASQEEMCVACPRGALVDMADETDGRHYRRMFCMEGMPDPALCTYQKGSLLQIEVCLEDRERLRRMNGAGR